MNPLAVMRILLCRSIALLLSLELVAQAAPNTDALDRGRKIFVEKCQLCHQAAGQGAPPVYPPLAGSDWFAANRQRAMEVLCEGLSGALLVNGQSYQNTMPAQMLDDAEAADVLSFVGSSWGNAQAPFTAEEVSEARKQTRFKTYADLVKASAFQALPQAPEGWKVREVVALPEFCTRLAGTEKSLYALAQGGTIYGLDLASKALVPVVKAEDYIDAQRGEYVAQGFTVDPQGRLWVVTNQKLTKDVPIYLNEVVIWRSNPREEGVAIKMSPWFKTTYPRGIGGMNHGVSHLAFGPDDQLYVSSGSRTDGGELSKLPNYFDGHEVDLTSCIWRLNPNAAHPEVEVIARGIRNAFGFAWDAEGHLFTVSNGPDADAPEEMDFIEPGKHYGFPYQFSDWPVQPGFPYPHTPVAPPNLKFTLPVTNLGPAAGGTAQQPLSTFDPHSSPAGMIWCGPEFPAPLRNGFLMTRFGNLLGAPAVPDDVGFDLISLHLERHPDGSWLVRSNSVLEPLGRPIDLLDIGNGHTLILEYTRSTNFKEKLGMLPGRILELYPTNP